MKRLLKIAAICAGLLVVLLVAAPFLIPVDQFRPEIEAKASQALGRQVQFGSLSLSLWSGSVAASNLSIADDASFSQTPFLQAKSIDVGVKLMPLVFSKSLEITGITIESPTMTLLQNAAGKWNYSSLGGSQQESAQTGSTPSSLVIEKFTLKDGSVNIGSTTSQKRNTYDKVEVDSTNVSLTSQFPVNVSAELPGGGTFKLTGNVGPVNAGNATVTPLDTKIEVNGLNLASSGLVDASAGLGGLLDVSANFTSQNGVAATNGTATLTKALLVAGGSPATMPVSLGFNTSFDLNKSTGVLNPSTLKIGSATAQLSGTYAMGADATTVNLKLSAPGMAATELEAFLPALGVNLPKGARLASGTVTANLDIAGAINALVTTGNVGLFTAKLAGFDLGSKMSGIASLVGVKTGSDLAIDKVTTDLRVAPNGIRVDNFLAVLPSLGSLAGAGNVNGSNQLDFKMVADVTNALGTLAAPVSGVAALMGKSLGTSSGCKGGTKVPFQIQGTMSDPKFVPDVGGAAASLLKSQLGCLGTAASGTSSTSVTKAAGAVNGIIGLFGKKKTN